MVFRPRNPAFLGAASGAVPDQVSGQDSTANSTSQITVTWNAVTAIPAVTSYTVQWSANGSSNWADIAESVGNVTSIADASLSTYTTYYYRIKANNAMGGGTYSSNTSDTTAGVLPNQVTSLTATLDGDDVDLAWSVPSFGTPNTGTYTVQRSTSSGSGFSDIVSSHGTNSYTNTSPTTGTTYYYQVKAVNAFGSGSYSSEASILVPSPPNAVFGGGAGNAVAIESLNISTTGNSTSFGSLSSGRYNLGAVSNTTRGVFLGGYNNNTMDYVTIATAGNAVDFGNMDYQRDNYGSVSNGTRGVTGGGSGSGTDNSARMEYITIASTGNGTNMGSLSAGRNGCSGVGSTTRGLFGGGHFNNYDVIDYITISSNSGAADFGNLSLGRGRTLATGNGSRGVWAGGGSSTDYARIDYVTISSTGNASDYGALYEGVYSGTGVANATRAVFINGRKGAGGAYFKSQYITISSGGTAAVFGNVGTGYYGGGCDSVTFT